MAVPSQSEYEQSMNHIFLKRKLSVACSMESGRGAKIIYHVSDVGGREKVERT